MENTCNAKGRRIDQKLKELFDFADNINIMVTEIQASFETLETKLKPCLKNVSIPMEKPNPNEKIDKTSSDCDLILVLDVLESDNLMAIYNKLKSLRRDIIETIDKVQF